MGARKHFLPGFFFVGRPSSPGSSLGNQKISPPLSMIFGDHRLEMKKLPLFFGIPDDLISFLGCLELGKISTDSHSQDEKRQRRIHLEKRI